MKQRLREEFRSLDPVELLRHMRDAQRRLVKCQATGVAVADVGPAADLTVGEFVESLATAWQAGEVRPTHRRKARVPHDRCTGDDPFEHTWPTIKQWLEAEPGVTAKKLHARLVAMAPAMYSGAQLRTLQRKVKAWRSNRAKEL